MKQKFFIVVDIETNNTKDKLQDLFMSAMDYLIDVNEIDKYTFSVLQRTQLNTVSGYRTTGPVKK